MRIGRSMDAAIAAHALLTITHGAVTDLADQTDIGTHAALDTGVHGVGAAYVALGAHAAMPAVDRDGDVLLGAEFRRQGDANSLQLHGGNSYGARMELFGKDAGANQGKVQFTVPNAAENARVIALEFSGCTDNPEMLVGRIPRARIPDWDHAGTHEDGGADEISVAGLSGLLADDQNPVAHGAAEHTNRNRTLPLIPFLCGSGVPTPRGKFATYALPANTDFGCASFRIPTGFVSFVSAIVEIIPIGNGDFDWTVESEQLKTGENLGTDTDTATANNQPGNDDQMLSLDITAALDDLTLEVGDKVGVKFIRDAVGTITDLRLIGLSVALEMDE